MERNVALVPVTIIILAASSLGGAEPREEGAVAEELRRLELEELLGADLEEVRKGYEAIAARAAGETRAEARLLLARVLQRKGDLTRAAELLRELLAEPTLQGFLRARAETMLEQITRRSAGGPAFDWQRGMRENPAVKQRILDDILSLSGEALDSANAEVIERRLVAWGVIAEPLVRQVFEETPDPGHRFHLAQILYRLGDFASSLPLVLDGRGPRNHNLMLVGVAAKLTPPGKARLREALESVPPEERMRGVASVLALIAGEERDLEMDLDAVEDAYLRFNIERSSPGDDPQPLTTRDITSLLRERLSREESGYRFLKERMLGTWRGDSLVAELRCFYLAFLVRERPDLLDPPFLAALAGDCRDAVSTFLTENPTVLMPTVTLLAEDQAHRPAVDRLCKLARWALSNELALELYHLILRRTEELFAERPEAGLEFMSPGAIGFCLDIAGRGETPALELIAMLGRLMQHSEEPIARRLYENLVRPAVTLAPLGDEAARAALELLYRCFQVGLTETRTRGGVRALPLVGSSRPRPSTRRPTRTADPPGRRAWLAARPLLVPLLADHLERDDGVDFLFWFVDASDYASLRTYTTITYAAGWKATVPRWKQEPPEPQAPELDRLVAAWRSLAVRERLVEGIAAGKPIPLDEAIYTELVNDTRLPAELRARFLVQCPPGVIASPERLAELLRHMDHHVLGWLLPRSPGPPGGPIFKDYQLLELSDDFTSADVFALLARDTRREILRTVIPRLEQHTPRSFSEPFAGAWLENPDPEVRQHALKLLLSYRSRDVAPALIPLLGDTDPTIRAEAARGLGRLGVIEAEDAIRKLVTEPLPEVRDRAIEALEQIEAIRKWKLDE